MGDARDRRAAILTGERGVGKTTLCLDLARGRPEFAGIVSPAIFDSSGHKVGFAALCLETGEQWELGRSDRDLGGPRYGRYSFSADGFARAIECLRAALELPGRVVVLDEIGPLEIEAGEGFATVLPLLEVSDRLLVVTRPTLSSTLVDRLDLHECRQFSALRGAVGHPGIEIAAFLGCA